MGERERSREREGEREGGREGERERERREGGTISSGTCPQFLTSSSSSVQVYCTCMILSSNVQILVLSYKLYAYTIHAETIPFFQCYLRNNGY